jgi:FAD/FMN-containing dehydrogenase
VIDPDAVVGEAPKDMVFDKARIAFGENYPRLQEVKKIYDPKGLFNKWFPIVPA